MKFAKQDKTGSANGIAALAILKMLLDALLKKQLLSREEADIIINCAGIEVATAEVAGNVSEARYLIENLLLVTDEDTERTLS
jgi:hypothetical protein